MIRDEILGYPVATPEIIAARRKELAVYGLTTIWDYGGAAIANQSVLGIGYVGVVVLVERAGQKLALKIRRTNIDKHSLIEEAHCLERANTVAIAPMVMQWSQNFILMEYIAGERFFDWLQRAAINSTKTEVWPVVVDLLEQSFRLDQLGLDRGDMNCVTNDVLMRAGQPVLIDFSRGSGDRRPQNVTALVQGLFWGSVMARYLTPFFPHCTKEILTPLLRNYKHQRNRANFDAILIAIAPMRKSLNKK
ncbi:MAG: hypothetical protein HC799_15935 [Limnothrix sp. RL_2_0]|nr:hypothetical protein [Limnothrix sp. RL_2_0]